MHLLLSTGTADARASYGNGGPESGPASVLAAFLPTCERLAAEHGGAVSVIAGQSEAKAALAAIDRGQDRVHLCFALPDQCFEVAGCPTVPVFGWGLGSIPVSAEGGPGPDWRAKLSQFGRAICLSSHAAQAVSAAMGQAFPVCSVAPPIAAAGEPPRAAPAHTRVGTFPMLDTATWTQHRPPVADFDAGDDLADAVAATPGEEVLFRAPPPWRKTLRYRLGTTRLHARNWYHDALADLLPRPVARAGSRAARGVARAAHFALVRGEQRKPAPPVQAEPGEAWPEAPLILSGTVFAAVHGVWDRSWSDAISAFVWTFRDEPAATLLLRSAGIDVGTRDALAAYLRRLLPFRCRVVLLDARLDPAEANRLADACAFYVCASHAEAVPLPMMLFLARGRPAVTPLHSALADVADEDCAVLVRSSVAHDYWTNDPRERLLTTSHRLDWDSLCGAFRRAFTLAASPGQYATMQRRAADRMVRLNTEGATALAAFLGRGAAGRDGDPA